MISNPLVRLTRPILGCLLLASLFSFAAGANAAPTIELKNGKTVEIQSLSRKNGAASIVTSGGMRLDLPESQILSPVEKWLAVAKEAEQEGRFEDALEYLRLTAAWDPAENDPARLALIEAKIHGEATGRFQAEIEAGNYSAAAETYKALAKSPGPAAECQTALAQLLAKAKQAADTGQFDAAAELCNGYLTIVPNSPEANQILADIDTARSQADFDQRMKKAESHIQARQFDAARRTLIALQREKPDDALVKSKIEEVEKAAFEDQLNGLLYKAKLALDDGDAEAGQAFCSQIQSLSPNHPKVQELLQGIARVRAEFFASVRQNPCVVCAKSPNQSYFLFLPPNCDPRTPAPIVYVFSPNGGDDNGALGRFIANVAGKQGWIVAQSRNSQNGPWQPILDAQDALLYDTSRRLNLHPTRRFATGFSGGGRASLAMAFRHPGKIVGVMPMGAVWPINTKFAPTTNRLAVCILMGASDGNRNSVANDVRKLREAGVGTNVITHPGGHEWPPESVVKTGFDWLTANAP